jgi:hypothetical protein
LQIKARDDGDAEPRLVFGKTPASRRFSHPRISPASTHAAP